MVSIVYIWTLNLTPGLFRAWGKVGNYFHSVGTSLGQNGRTFPRPGTPLSVSPSPQSKLQGLNSPLGVATLEVVLRRNN
jgi:hypothetical protein